jgi:alginate O-acetyltransferase complex protein AlgI
MVFSSAIFLFYFFPIFLILYFVIPYKYKNITALIASVFFFSWGAPDFIFLLLASITIDFFLGNEIFKSKTKKRKKLFLIFSLFLNIGMLAYFKYANFFVENINALFESTGIGAFSWAKVALPIGISFFTFQKMSYIIDIYKYGYKPLKKITDLILYIILFPQLIAGPIVRYNEIRDQLIDRRSSIHISNKMNGLMRFIIGLSKKMLIANPMGEQVDLAFQAGVVNVSSAEAWIVILAYALQIYYDFSGYSDMAIGIGHMLGFSFPENFRNPYISGSITEFWRRWHMTLSRWMRDYLYIPLGGNKVSVIRMYLNLSIVFLISGLWHGAAWNFIIWGAFHGFFLILDRLFLLKVLQKIGKVPAVIFTFVLTLFGWVLFRAESFPEIAAYVERMFAFDSIRMNYAHSFWSIFAIGIFFSFIPAFFSIEKRWETWYEPGNNKLKLACKVFICMIMLLLCFSEVVSTGFNPFIYFRF